MEIKKHASYYRYAVSNALDGSEDDQVLEWFPKKSWWPFLGREMPLRLKKRAILHSQILT